MLHCLASILGVSHLVTAALACLAAAQLAVAWYALRRTTLGAPIAWAAIAVSLIAVAQLVVPATSKRSFADYAAAILLLTPGLAVLGAKRPQHAAWQFIVLTFAVVLLLPGLRSLAVADAEPNLHSLFRWLNLVVFAVGVLNYAPTTYGPAVGLAGLGIGGYLFPWLPGGAPSPNDLYQTTSIVLLNLGLSIAWFTALRRRRAPPGLQKLWRDFRDAYGVVWGLRVAERLNVAACKHRWPIEFGWNAIYVAVPREPPPDEVSALPALKPAVSLPTTAVLDTNLNRLEADVRRRVERELCSLLRRFVSADWIAARLAKM